MGDGKRSSKYAEFTWGVPLGGAEHAAKALDTSRARCRARAGASRTSDGACGEMPKRAPHIETFLRTMDALRAEACPR